MKKILLILILLILSSCASTKYNKDYRERRGLMLLESNEYARNKPLKYDKKKTKAILQKKAKKHNKKRK